MRRYMASYTVALVLLPLPCLAGPCASDIDAMQMNIASKLSSIAAAGPAVDQTVGAQMHRQPTPDSVATRESALGEVSASKIEEVEEVKNAMARARQADAAGDKTLCERALNDVQRALTP
jgi:hypothetical protein